MLVGMRLMMFWGMGDDVEDVLVQGGCLGG